MSQESHPSPDHATCPRCGAPTAADALAGNCPACLWAIAAAEDEEPPGGGATRRLGSYELVEEVGRGGMGIVWRARHVELRREVAFKMILAGHLAASAQVVRFYSEARAAARLDHPGIVPIYEIGEDDGRHYYTMMLMEGGSLAERLERGPSLTEREGARIVSAAARAIHFAHQRGVLHRDVKPSNILLDRDGRPRIGDFGLARLADHSSDASRSHPVLGTPAYMAPEQAIGNAAEVTTAADVYGLGAVLYEILGGVPPFHGASPLESLRLLLEREPLPPRARRPRVDRDLEVICLKCLQKEPERRYASAGELADDLERWLAGEPIRARPVTAVERIASWARRRRDLATTLAGLFVVLVAALATTIVLLLEVQKESDARAAALRAEEGQRLAFQSLAVVPENPGQALLLALAAAARSPSLSANNALLASLESCHELRRFLGHERMVRFVAFSADGGRLATASHDGTARIWDVDRDGGAIVLSGHEGVVRTAVFSPDGTRVLTAGDDATARLWEAASGREIAKLSGHENPLKGAFFSAGGSRIVTLGQDTARLWDGGGAPIRALDHDSGASSAELSPDGSRIVTGGVDGGVKVWESASGAPAGAFSAHGEKIGDIAFSADGKVLATAAGPEARVWDAATFAELGSARRHEHRIYSLALTSDGSRLATGSEDFSARIWDARTGRLLHTLPHGHKVVSVDISRDDLHLLTASYDERSRVWDLGSGGLVAEMRGHAAPLYHAVFAPDGRTLASASVDYTARLWSIAAPAPRILRSAVSPVVASADLARDGRTVVVADGGSPVARVLDLDSRREIACLRGHEGDIAVVRFDGDGELVVTGSADATARLWEARGGKPLRTLSGHEGTVHEAAFSPDGRRVLTVGADWTARVWNVADGSPAAIIQAEGRIMTATFSPESDRISVVDEARLLRIARIATGEVAVFGIADPIAAADFTLSGEEIVLTTGTTRAQLRRLSDRSISGTLIHSSRVAHVLASPDRRWIATLGQDAAVRIWDAATREERLEIKRAGKLARSIRFSNDGRHLLLTWMEKGVRDDSSQEVGIYPLDVLEAARAARFGELTPDERDHYLVGSPEERREHRASWKGGHIFGAGDQDRPQAR